jgi:hypothetical protein
MTPNATFLYDVVPMPFKDPFATASLVRNGQSVGSAYLQGQLVFSGTPIALPPAIGALDDPTSISLSQAFDFRGAVTGYDRLLEGPFDPDPTFTASLTGWGTARMTFIQEPTAGGVAYRYFETTYEFTPVPEPLSLLTVGAGLTALWRRRRTM